ncbi:MAG: T9SS type A sorting domain-containing protein [Sphingobacteriales bacterium]|nr:MAG: T9SS type A sorting domain-containing protein [Sphingobacteriales bacterium]
MLKKISLTALFATAMFFAKAQNYMTMDMVHHNPGDTLTRTMFLDPDYLKSYGYDAKVFFLSQAPDLGITWDTFDPAIFPAGSKERAWVVKKDAEITKIYNEAKAKGVKVYCAMDMLVIPTALFNKYRDSIASKDKGGTYRIDITRPATQKLFRYMLQQIFIKYPQVDGLIIRTGETYVQDCPYHKGNSPVYDSKFDNHTILINILRDEVCVKKNKPVIYRTWDFGQFHSLPKYYLQVTDQVETHPNLYFGIKHTNVDYWRNGIANTAYNPLNNTTYWINQANDNGVYFNPTLGIGKHKQIVEVQCQREYEGKASHPNYIAKGVIDGFDELKKPGLPTLNSLNELKKSPLLAGVWTWSRGGGWGGPRIPSEFWADLNAYVVTQWAKNPSKSEEDIFAAYAKLKGLPDAEVAKFHELALLSDQGVFKGQYSAMGQTSVLWTRDDNYQGNLNGLSYLNSGFDKVIKANRVELYLAEKAEAVEIWKKIESLSKELHFASPYTNSFVQVSCTYGKLKYQTFQYAWNVMLRGYAGTRSGKTINQVQMGKDILAYDRSLAEWKKWVLDHPNSPSMYSSSGFDATINQYRANAVYTDGVININTLSEGKKVKLSFTTLLNVHDHIEVQHTTDTTKSWTTVATLTGNTSANPKTDFTTEFANPAPGQNYYRIVLYDAALKTTVTNVLVINAKSTAVLNTFTAQLTGGKVKLNFTVSGQVLNPGFGIGRNANSKGWTELKRIAGGGTLAASNSFEYIDNAPETGRNDYVVAYYVNGVLKYSPIKTVDVAAPLAENSTFSIYPNPVAANVAFALKGYKGKSITVTLTDLFGKAVARETFKVSPEERYILKAKPSKGTYILNVAGNDFSRSGKVFVSE